MVGSVCTDCLSIELIDGVTSQSLCHLTRANGGLIYGTGPEAGNEAGFLVGVGACLWSYEDAPTYQRDRPMRMIATYNSSAERYGVMVQWKFAVVPAAAVAVPTPGAPSA
jgi:hypothetical protein